MADFDQFVAALKEGIKPLARETLEGFEDQALDDAQAFLDKARRDLQRWTQLLAQGQLTQQDFSDLVHAKMALVEIHALGQAGIALTRLERFRSGLINLIIDTAFDVFL